MASLISATQASNTSLTGKTLFARDIARHTRTYFRIEPLEKVRLLGAMELARLCTELDPDNIEAWYELLDLAITAEDEPTLNLAVDQLLRLEPSNDVMQLRRINRQIEQRQTLESRSELYERLLAPSNRDSLGVALASRLALDYALLLRRADDIEGFARWLGEAAAIDPANRSAAAIAAGFFSSRMNDPYATAELLLAAALSDPTDPNLQLELGSLLLREGAYQGAARLYDMAIRAQDAQGFKAAPNLVADFALALWADNQQDRALAAIHEQQIIVDLNARYALLKDSTKLTRVDVANVRGNIAPALATVRAAIWAQRQQSGWELTLQQVITSYLWAIEQLEAKIPDHTTLTPEQQQWYQSELARLKSYIAELRLEAAFVSLWLGGDYSLAAEQLELAENIQPLADHAKARFNGWLTLRRGGPENALAILAPLAQSDPGARLGEAEALLALNRVKEAARSFLDVTRSQCGTALGVWASHRLWSLIGQSGPVSPTADRLNKLVATMPLAFARLPTQPTMGLAVSIKPTKSSFGPFDSILLELTLTNKFQLPLAIDASGPIDSQVIVTLRGQIVHSNTLQDLQPMVIDVGRRLRLAPGESVTVTVDLRRHPIGGLLTELAILGASFRAFVISNARIEPGGLPTADLLGSRIESPTFRVDGIRLNIDWVMQTMADLTRMPVEQRVPFIALLANSTVVANQIGARDVVDMKQQIVDFVNASAAELDPASQAWLLLAIPLTMDFIPIRDMARKSEHELVRIAYLLSMLESETDTYIDTAMAEGTDRVRRIARMVQSALELRTRMREAEAKKAAAEAASGGSTSTPRR